MRIIGGSLKRRLLHSPPETAQTRPIPDRVKESLFAILRGHCENARVLDLFSGTGAIGLETVSRGAKWCLMVERDRSMAKVLERNITELGASDRAELAITDALGPSVVARCGGELDLAFLDPPYALVTDRAMFERVRQQMSRIAASLTDTGFMVLRTPWPAVHEQEVDEAGNPIERAPERNPSRGPRGAKPGPRGGRSERGRDAREHDDPRASRGKRHTPRPFEHEGDELVEIELDEHGEPIGLDDVDAMLMGEDTAGHEAHGPRIVSTPVDLKIPGAIGPETHEYGSMAVHLYMRDKGEKPA
ncbi:MAG: RsmD family RNA methyltransferase [Phycisphaerales bacterium]|jgi:16S rRNA (guanine966-N2)-methyltransferase|nr:RsmD family RNA methyltransferase [Phycisphaerales bacterium]